MTDEELKILCQVHEQELWDQISCWNGLENEVLKLSLLVENLPPLKTKDGQDAITIEYALEKINRLLDRTPIILSPFIASLYIRERKSQFYRKLINPQ